MNEGRIEQQVRRSRLYRRPARCSSRVPGHAADEPDPRRIGRCRSVRDFPAETSRSTAGPPRPCGDAVVAAIRPQQLLACRKATVPQRAGATWRSDHRRGRALRAGIFCHAVRRRPISLTAAVDPASRLASRRCCATVWTEPTAVLLFDAATGRGWRDAGATTHRRKATWTSAERQGRRHHRRRIRHRPWRGEGPAREGAHLLLAGRRADVLAQPRRQASRPSYGVTARFRWPATSQPSRASRRWSRRRGTASAAPTS